MPESTIGDLRFHVQRLGKGWADLDVAPAPAVMVHGLFTGSLASWYFTSAPAVAKHRPVLLYDLRGHGRTEHPVDGDYSSAAQVDDLLHLTAALRPFHLVGHSFGGLVALRFALAHPDRVASLTLVEPPVRGGAPDAPAWWWTTAADESAASTPSANPRAAELVAAANARTASATAGGRWQDADLSEEHQAILRSLRHEPEVTDGDLVGLPTSVSFVLGDRSAAVQMAPRIRRLRPDAEILVLRAGHSVHVDARRELTDHLVRFLLDPADLAAAVLAAPSVPLDEPSPEELELIAYG